VASCPIDSLSGDMGRFSLDFKMKIQKVFQKKN